MAKPSSHKHQKQLHTPVASPTNRRREMTPTPPREKPSDTARYASFSHEVVKKEDTSQSADPNEKPMEIIPMMYHQLRQLAMDSSEQGQMSYANQELVLENLESLRRTLEGIGERIESLEDKISCR